MAFWGAPIANAEHAADAVARGAGDAARRCRRSARASRARGWPAIAIGVGVNTGTMSVGDMGSRFRKAYTVLGDAVNLASRLEGLTKVYGVPILCGEATRAAVPDLVWREIDRVRVKGRASAVAIFEPLAEAGDAPAQARASRWEAALGALPRAALRRGAHGVRRDRAGCGRPRARDAVRHALRHVRGRAARTGLGRRLELPREVRRRLRGSPTRRSRVSSCPARRSGGSPRRLRSRRCAC